MFSTLLSLLYNLFLKTSLPVRPEIRGCTILQPWYVFLGTAKDCERLKILPSLQTIQLALKSSWMLAEDVKCMIKDKVFYCSQQKQQLGHQLSLCWFPEHQFLSDDSGDCVTPVHTLGYIIGKKP